MSEFFAVSRLEQVPPDTGTTFTVADKQLAVFNVSGTVHADRRWLPAR